jgi:hypothetical protein
MGRKFGGCNPPEYWTAGEGAAPSAERFTKGMATYLVVVVCPLAVDISLLF